MIGLSIYDHVRTYQVISGSCELSLINTSRGSGKTFFEHTLRLSLTLILPSSYILTNLGIEKSFWVIKLGPGFLQVSQEHLATIITTLPPPASESRPTQVNLPWVILEEPITWQAKLEMWSLARYY